jgi:hypothetical protein
MAHLDPAVRAGGSAFQQLEPAALDRGLRRREADLSSGAWQSRYSDLLTADTMDYGLRLIVS